MDLGDFREEGQRSPHAGKRIEINLWDNLYKILRINLQSFRLILLFVVCQCWMYCLWISISSSNLFRAGQSMNL